MNTFVVIMQLLPFLLPIFILVVAYAVGSYNEQRHYERLEQSELSLKSIMVCDLKRLPANWDVQRSALVCGEVVIANDRFKAWLAHWINLFGGRISCYEALVERARREAIVRMLEEARMINANAVWNVRVETATIQGKSQAGGVEVLAYGTAVAVKA